MPTPVFVCGAECNSLAHWSSTVGSPTMDTTPVRTGARSLHITATGAQEYFLCDVAAGNRKIVSSFYVRYHSFPTAVAECWMGRTASSNSARIFYQPSNGHLQASFFSGTIGDGPAISLDTWYRIDLIVDTSANPTTIDWAVDGVTQGQGSSAQAAHDVIGARAGSFQFVTTEISIDDFVLSLTAADYPIGAHTVVLNGATEEFVGPEILLDAALSGSGTLAAALTTEIRMAAALAGSGVVAAGLTTSITMAAAISGSASISADLSTSPGDMSAQLSATATLSAALTTEISIAAALSGSGVVSGTLSNTAALLAAVLSGAASLSATLFNPDLSLHWRVFVDWSDDGFAGIDDISLDVRSIAWQRGAGRQFGSAEPGGCSIEVQNGADKYLDTNPASPLTGKLRVGHPVWIAASYLGSDYPIFAGVLQRIVPRGSDLPVERSATLIAVDPRGSWSRHAASLAPHLSGVSVTAARSEVLDQLGVAAGQRDLGSEDSMLQVGQRVTFTDDAGVEVSFDAGLDDNADALLQQLSVLLARDWIRPTANPLQPWQYVSRNRNATVDAPVEFPLTYGDDFDALDGWNVSDETVLNDQTVQPRQVATAAPSEASAQDAGSIATYGKISGPTISSDLIPSLATAQGVADHLVWRFAAARQRPQLLLQRRAPLMFQADLFDVVAVTDRRFYLTDRRCEIVGIRGHWAGPLCEIAWQLQEMPPSTNVFTLGGDALGSAAILGR